MYEDMYEDMYEGIYEGIYEDIYKDKETNKIMAFCIHFYQIHLQRSLPFSLIHLKINLYPSLPFLSDLP